MLPDLWTAQTDAPPTRSLEIALRFPQHPQPKPKVFQPHNQPVHQIGAASSRLLGDFGVVTSDDTILPRVRAPSGLDHTDERATRVGGRRLGLAQAPALRHHPNGPAAPPGDHSPSRPPLR